MVSIISHQYLALLILLVIPLWSTHGHGTDSNKTESIKLVDWDIKETETYLIIAIFILLVSFGKLLYHKLEWLASYVPESLLLIIFGIAGGAIYKYSIDTEKTMHLTSNLFFLVLLPPIVLDSAYRMYNRTFSDIIGIVLILAVIGTVFSFFLIAGSLFGLELAGAMGSRPTDGSIMAVLLFSSFIVAVDPVAVLAIFKDIGVDKELYYMIFGESLLNDAVTIVLYEIIKKFIVLRDQSIKVIHVILGIASFFTVSGGGLLIGIIIGLLSSLLTRLQSHSNIHCITLIVSAYLSYLITNSLKWSGIIAIIACGIIQASYAFRNIELSTLSTLKEIVELASGVSEAIIFVYLGLELFMNELQWNIGFQIWSIIMCLVSRFIVLFVLRICINYARVDQRKITWTEFFVATYGGLRGAVAFSLVILIEADLIVNNDKEKDEKIRNLFITTTLLIIFFTVGIMGTTMKPLARLLNVKLEKTACLSICNELNGAVIDNLMSMIEVIIEQSGHNRFRLFVTKIDNDYIRPLLVNDPHDNLSFKILKRYQQITLALHYASTNKDHIEEHLTFVPRSLWPKNMVRSNKLSTQFSLLRSMSKISTTGSVFDPLQNESNYNAMLEMAHVNRVKDIIHRKASAVSQSDEVTPNSTSTINKPKMSFSFLPQSNLAFIDDEFEEEFNSVKTSKI